MTNATSLKDGDPSRPRPSPGQAALSLAKGEAHPAALAALQYLNAIGFQEKQDFLLTFSSLAIEGNRLAEVCYGTLRRIIDRQPVSDLYVLGLAWEINSIKTRVSTLKR